MAEILSLSLMILLWGMTGFLVILCQKLSPN